ncbi:MAG: histidinol dehydrogenase [Desulfovibrionaceae bacterium]|nr:histidinol dehydrogenase [Desulfovibrionaceae bacterium]
MICHTMSLRSAEEEQQLTSLLLQRNQPQESVETAVKGMIADVAERGDAALFDYCRKFDCPDMEGSLSISEETIQQAYSGVSSEELNRIRIAAGNIRAFHEAQKERSWFQSREDGTILGQMTVPVDRAGLYVPGGRGGNTPLLSSLLMTAIPAQVAGVKEIAVVSPPRADGSLNPSLLAAAHELGIREIYRMGGAWSIAALALGTKSVPKVDVIAGPGNIWVTTAKRLVIGRVGIDMIAGPSEVLILADSTANPKWIAADMLAQAEHDRLASAICLTTDESLARQIQICLEEQIATLPREEIARQSLAEWGVVAVVSDLDKAIDIANRIAPEHLEILTEQPWSVLPRIRHAGAAFLGPYSPETLGDYCAGPNHVLPTLSTARFSSALSVQTFSRRMSIISAGRAFAENHAPVTAALARMEQLEAHARSMECRVSR